MYAIVCMCDCKNVRKPAHDYINKVNMWHYTSSGSGFNQGNQQYLEDDKDLEPLNQQSPVHFS